MEKSKKCKESLTVMTNIVLPNETNSLNNMFGGELLARMDRAAAIAASRHSESTVVTASVNHVSFKHPIPEGGVVVVEAKISRAFSTSMEIYCLLIYFQYLLILLAIVQNFHLLSNLDNFLIKRKLILKNQSIDQKY